MTNETALFIEMWNRIRDLFGTNEAQAISVAEDWLYAFDEFGAGKAELADLLTEERVLAEAYTNVYLQDEDEPEYEDSEDDYEDDDEY